MNKTKQFALCVGAATMLIGTSAFAESRHSRETERSGDRGGRTNVERRSTEQRSTAPTYQRNETRSWNNNNRSYDRNNNYNRNETRSYDRSNDRNRTYDRNRSFEGNRSYDRNRGYENHGYDRNRGYENRSFERNRGNAFYHDGRISRIEHWNGGYRVWFGGFGYPFFVPEARFRLFNWRVGLSVHLGGYWNPLGYYDYYDGVDPYYTNGYYAPNVATSGYVRGVVESVDYRRGSMVIRDDASGSFVTILMRGDDPRFDSLRNGDYVSVSGDWVRGYFQAYRVDNVDDGYYRR
ncbi:MAG TPA: hypothetical protein VGR95_00015 [Thermoanaerobaculia bacterium]|nr:hypothetical protein [Thermoanaerobaculia bacterium]